MQMDSDNRPRDRHSRDVAERQLLNPYIAVPEDARPPELVDFELETDPYRNFLPGMSSVNAAKTVGRGLRVGRGGNPILLVVSLILVAVLVLPAFAAVIAQLLH
jgi:hypothetical protein